MKHILKIGNNKLSTNFGSIILKLHFDKETIFDFPLIDEYNYNCKINWGDGTSDYLKYFDDEHQTDDAIVTTTITSYTTTNTHTFTTTSSSITTTTTTTYTTKVNFSPADYFSKISHTYASGDYILTIDGLCETLMLPGNKNLIEIKSWGHPDITKLAKISFDSCKNLISLPNEMGGLRNIERFKNTFKSCISLKSVPNNIFWGNTIATEFNSIFLASGLEVIPENLFKTNTQVTTFKSIFVGTKIKKIPNNLFKYNINVESFENCFGATIITELPNDLFDNNTLAKNFKECFSNCNKLISLPIDLFDNNINAENFDMTFFQSSILSGIAPKLWDNTKWTKIQYHSQCFYHTGSIGTNRTTIPNTWGGSCDCNNDCINNCSGL
jgi:hypothetical protein